jgi:hypothetical protein
VNWSQNPLCGRAAPSVQQHRQAGRRAQRDPVLHGGPETGDSAESPGLGQHREDRGGLGPGELLPDARPRAGPEGQVRVPGGGLPSGIEPSAWVEGLRGRLIPEDDDLSLRDEAITLGSRSFMVKSAIDRRHDQQARISQ